MSNFIENPIIVILGSTATGKSKLAIELAKRFNGEVISADAMQVYKQLNIITNKVTADEQAQVKHHMMDLISGWEHFNVKMFKNQALDIINRLHSEKKIPVIVGGTYYYIEALLWDFLIDGDSCEVIDDNLKSAMAMQSGIQHTVAFEDPQPKRIKVECNEMPENSSPNQIQPPPTELPHFVIDKGSSNRAEESEIHATSCANMLGVDERSSEDNLKSDSADGDVDGAIGTSTKHDLFDRLLKIDSQRASQIHPNDVRQVARSIQIFETFGRKHSDLLIEQRNKLGASHLSGPLRFPKCIVFWLTCEKAILEQRICERTDGMIDRGLVQEIESYHKEYCASASNLDANPQLYTQSKCLLQAIGLKEFKDYLHCTDGDEKVKDMYLKGGLEAMKRVTIKYSKRQTRWVRNRFLSRKVNTAPDVYELDSTDLTLWHEKVWERAVNITENLLQDIKPSVSALQITEEHRQPLKKFICETCDNRVIMGDLSWNDHVISKAHKKNQAAKLNIISDSQKLFTCATCNNRVIQGDLSWKAHLRGESHKKHEAYLSLLLASVKTENSSVKIENPSVATENPSVATENPYVATENPYVATEDPYVETENHYVPTEDPYVATENPSVETEN